MVPAVPLVHSQSLYEIHGIIRRRAVGGEPFVLIFVSCDRDQASFDSYAASMSFPALSFDAKDANRALSEACGVSGIPSLCIFDEEMNLLTKNGRSLIMSTKPSAITADRTLASYSIPHPKEGGM